MNTQPNDGGPAFPCASTNYRQIGITLRDYLMIHAPAIEIDSCMPETAGELSQWLGVEKYTWKDHYPMAVAKARGIWADAMLAARERKEGDQ